MSYEELSKSVKLSEGFRNKIYQDTEDSIPLGGGIRLSQQIILLLIKNTQKKNYKQYLIKI